MNKLDEVRKVYESRKSCLRDGSHQCGGHCFALKAPRYGYNGGPYTPERKLRAEALAGDEEAIDALIEWTAECAAKNAIATMEDNRRLREGIEQLNAAGPEHVLLEEEGAYRVEPTDPNSEYGYGTSIVCHFGSEWAAEVMGG